MKYIDHGPDADGRLPAIPKLTPELQKEIDAQQAEFAASHPINAGNREYENAHALITQLEQQPLKSLGRFQREQYAEALAIVGQLSRAAKVTRDPLKAKEWKAVWKAIWIDDDKDCKCKDIETVVMENGRPTKKTFSQKFVVSKVFSHKHGDFITLKRCNSCSFSNATPTD